MRVLTHAVSALCQCGFFPSYPFICPIGFRWQKKGLKMGILRCLRIFCYTPIHSCDITHSINDISTMHLVMNLLKSSFLLWNKLAENRWGSCTDFKFFNHIQNIFGMDRKNNCVTNMEEQWDIQEEKGVLVHSSKENIPIVLCNSESYLGWIEMIRNLTGILYETSITFSKT